MWKQNADGLSDISVSNLGRWKDEGEWRPGKEHPGFGIADWLAVDIKATFDPENFDPALAADSSYVAQFATVWEAAQQQEGSFVKTLDLENEELLAAVIAHADKTT